MTRNPLKTSTGFKLLLTKFVEEPFSKLMVDRIAVGLQLSPEPLQHFRRPCPGTRWLVIHQDQSGDGTGIEKIPAPVIGPTGPAFRPILHQNAGFVCLNIAICQHFHAQGMVQAIQPGGHQVYPVRCRGLGNLYARFQMQLLHDPLNREVIEILGEHQMGQQALIRPALAQSAIRIKY